MLCFFLSLYNKIYWEGVALFPCVSMAESAFSNDPETQISPKIPFGAQHWGGGGGGGGLTDYCKSMNREYPKQLMQLFHLLQIIAQDM